MQFKVKDLMINVIPDPTDEVGLTCANGVTFNNCFRTTLIGCNGCTLTVTQVVDPCNGGPTFVVPTRVTTGCGVNYSTCFAGSNFAETVQQTTLVQHTTRTILEGNPLSASENLATLKQGLKEALSQVEAQEKLVAESLKPQSLEELEVLDEKLTAALEDVRSRKAQMG
ncbi:MAG: hypothetical protein AAFN12_01430 [Cyanobacteria bacterium J06560_2]